MALIVETGAVVTGADSYISLTDAGTYFTNHGSPSGWTGLSDPAKESALRYATQALDGLYEWTGEIVAATQALGWPRAGASDDEGRTFESNTVPTRVKDAVCELALLHVTDALNASYERGGAIKRQKTGPLETEYEPGASVEPALPHLDRILRGLGSPRSGICGELVRG